MKLPDADIRVLSISRLTLCERCSEHSVLTAELLLEAGDGSDTSKISHIIGKQLELTITDHFPPIVFKGIIDSIEVSPDHHVFIAYGPSFILDLVERTRSFDAEQPTEQFKLDGIAEVFPAILGLNQLQAKSWQILQHAETDWDLLVRLAGSNGAFLVTRDNEIRIVSTPVGDAVSIPREKVVSDRTFLGLTHATSEVVSWSWQTGTIPSGGAVHSEDGAGVEKLVEDATRELLSGDRHRIVQYADAADALRQAKLHSQRHRGRALRWWGKVRDFNLRPGDQVKLEDSQVIDVPMLIVGRKVDFESSRTEQLVVELECASHGAASERKLSSATDTPIRAVGEVISVDDSRNLGLVKVRLPWHPDRSNGTWCRLAQASAGVDHGTFDTPLNGDWVEVLHWPKSYEPPLVVGAVYHGKSGLRDRIGNLTTRRTILMMPGGQRILADEQAGMLLIGIEDGANPACQISFSKDPVGITLKTAEGGKIVISAADIDLQASGSITIRGQVSIE